MPKYDFLVVGSCTVDIFARTSHIERIDISGHEAKPEQLVCIPFGSKTDLEALELWPGGSAANSAVAISRLGSKAAVLGCVGNDYMGTIALKDMEKSKVDVSSVIVAKQIGTGVGVNITATTGEKSVLVYRGANDVLGPEHLKEEMVKGSRHVFITSLVSQKNFALFQKLVRLAKKHHRTIIFAPSITMLHHWLPQLRKLHAHFAVSIFNYEESSYYTGKEKVKGVLRHLPGNVDVVSKDVDGAYAKEGSSFFHASALPVSVIDTIGAGDCFSGAFAHYYCSSKNSVSEALAKAVIVAGLKIAQKGSRLSSSAAQTAAFVKRNKPKVKLSRV